ncbi:pentatricopeptide repeat-containing protein At5g47360 [Macadamia integrifolia]|uniref:pentatricopeptide repeat-containing protein At5g47360 n=1 Tax=Macadamia integrifolia TaxID=60698 RepID=UPI001C4E5164|nr:pentatricopeptide repeat-containing protein At5g47360 [Macadamia integrifolia]XP_042504751.1 pentatricopeptide repeat-containing protein At5g47360 [Macadamia integrifolia]XP_042504752.1 pentatricopeptide repeat-containing protein At5g47360 [Macadamia integrifolia]XP_042504753.1 pentatricopeptide repeat-containing protein At5g47360 [Macadamia integrifolia]XP_042504754.1 pentatricopeptide repeat-containing protein At5g47360 [Macadamia integrifolia]
MSTIVHSIFRFISTSYGFRNPRYIITQKRMLGSTSAADNYWNLLQKNDSGSGLERNLGKTNGKLDALCVEDVLRRCSSDRAILGLRFFIWAGLQSYYRHSSLMYNKVCQLFEIDRKPQLLNDVLEVYRIRGSLVTVKVFKVILNLCKEAKLAEEALGVLRKMGEFNCRPDTSSYNVVIRLFSEKGDMDVASGLMKEMSMIDLYPDMLTYIEMIKGFCNVGRFEEACGLFKVMHTHGCVPSVVAYSALLDGFCRAGNMERAMELLGDMEKVGGDCSPNTVTYTSVIQSFCEKRRSTEALGFLDRMMAHGCRPNRVTISTLIKGLCVEGRIEEAYKLVDKVVVNGSVSSAACYSSLVVCLLRIKNIKEAEKLFRRMLNNGVQPDGLACNCMMKEICLEGRAMDGFGLYCEMEKFNSLDSVDSDFYSVLLAGLCHESHLLQVAEVVNAMIKKRFRLKTPHLDVMVECLEKSGQKELALHLAKLGT